MASPTNYGSSRPLSFRRNYRVNLRFRIPYFTEWGQHLAVVGSHASLGGGNPRSALAMKTPLHSDRDGELFWESSLPLPADKPFQIEYHYCVRDGDCNVVRQERSSPRSFTLPTGLPNGSSINIFDLWQDPSSPESFLSRSAFQEIIFRQTDADEVDDYEIETLENHVSSTIEQLSSGAVDFQDTLIVQFKISCPRLKSGQVVHLTGTAKSLGNWEFASSLKLGKTGGSDWQGNAVIQRSELPLKYPPARYKYIVKDKAGKAVPEVGSERRLHLDAASQKTAALAIISDGYLKEEPWRGVGLAVPVFALRSMEDVGVGEFLDLEMLVDFAVNSGMHLIQLLPINDTSVHKMWWDSYPYSSLSVFALHPLYLRVQALSKNIPEHIKEEIDAARKKLNSKHVDYEATMVTKLGIAKKIFLLEKDEVFSSASYRKFFSENQEWLKPYAVFCFLRDFFGTSDHSRWGIYSEFSPAKLEKFTTPASVHYNVITFQYYLQFHLHLQLSEAASYAGRNGVVLKGDLPIGVDCNSVDTWVYPKLFRMNTSTGAPPDYFDKNGQNWGFPTYNWEEMSKDNYGWWRARLSQMAKYFTAYRIDHVLGFFRIWELPDHAAMGLLGKFRPSLPLTEEELVSNGIWDFNRLCQPYVKCHLLQKRFGDEWQEVASTYFHETSYLSYEFQEEYNTEKKIVAAAKVKESMNEEIKNNLLELLREVVLIRDPEDGRKFYPRFGLESTDSFHELDNHSKYILYKLYRDYFFHRQEDLWRENAFKTLPALLQSSNMLACGEDLGLIPGCVPPVMYELGLIGLRIQRMPNAADQDFAIPADYEYVTVCATSCHDCSPLRAWWEDLDETMRIAFFRDILDFSDTPPLSCTPELVYAMIQQHMEAPSMWAIFPLQDILALKEEHANRPAKEEVINNPTNPKHYWRFRVHVPLEKLVRDSELSTMVRELAQNSGRSTPAISLISDRNSISSALDVKNGQFESVNALSQKLQVSGNGGLEDGVKANSYIMVNGHLKTMQAFT